MQKQIRILLILIACFISINIQATENRYALVIGNADYDGSAKLKNPVNDAQDITLALEEIGWDVTLVKDADRREMTRSIVKFRDKAKQVEDPSVLVYYAGHGMQIDGENYLIPVRTPFETVDDVELDAISINYISEALEYVNPDMSLLILDACRDNPFAKTGSRSTANSRGLSVVQVPGGETGSAIIFATSPGDVALDGKGDNGIFTSSLLKHIDSTDKLEDMFRNVTQDVKKITNSNQVPWLNASLSADFYLVSKEIRDNKERILQAEKDKKYAEELSKAAEAARLEEAKKQEALLKEIEDKTAALEAANRALLDSEESKRKEAQAALEQALKEKEIAEQEANASLEQSKKLAEEAMAALKMLEDQRDKLTNLSDKELINSKDGDLSLTISDSIESQATFKMRQIKEGRENSIHNLINNSEIKLISGIQNTIFPIEDLEKSDNFVDKIYKVGNGTTTLPIGLWLLSGKKLEDELSTYYRLININGNQETILEISEINHSIPFQLREAENRYLSLSPVIDKAKKVELGNKIWGTVFAVPSAVGLAGTIFLSSILVGYYDDYKSATRPSEIPEQIDVSHGSQLLDFSVFTLTSGLLSYYFYSKKVPGLEFKAEYDSLSIEIDLLKTIVGDNR